MPDFDNSSKSVPQSDASREPRREFLKQAMATGLGAAGLAVLAACGRQQDAARSDTPEGSRRLRAAIGNAGLQSTWCALGKTTAELWGNLLDVDVTWFDGAFNVEKQRSELERLANQEWDFVAVQAYQIDSLEPAIRRLKSRNIPVIGMDTHLVAMERMREAGVWVQIEPDQEFMGRTSTQYLVDKIGGSGKVIHIGGHSGHSGAKGREKGFNSVIANYPEIEVVGGGVRWCDWEKEKARSTFSALLNQSREKISGAFFHSDDMALGAIEALKGSRHEGMIVTGVDGQREGLNAIQKGILHATTVNPVCLIHMNALVIGQFIVRNRELVENLPHRIVTPGPLVSRDTGNVDAMLYMADPKHCLV
jgi:ribose transport system substrate-binding protein